MRTDYISFNSTIITSPPAGMGVMLPVNVSYFQGFHNFTFPSGRVKAIPTVRPVPVVDLINNFSVNPHVGSQRRRNLQSR
jgi:hypothetical protein